MRIRPQILLFAIAFIVFPVSAAQPRQSDLYPDPALTPGATYQVSEKDVCSHGYARRTRNVSTATKREVFRRYRVKYFPHAYEVDHFIPLCLGGSNDVANLWPEPIEDAVDKDKVEDYLCREVCAGKLPLNEAQTKIRTDWKGVYDNEVRSHSTHRRTTKKRTRKSAYLP